MAHEIRPAIATFAMQPNGDYSITISLNLEAILSGIGAEHEDTDDSPNAERYNNLRELPPNDLRSAFQPFEAEFLEGVTLRFGDDIAESPQLGQLTIPEIGDLELARISEVVLTGVVPYGAESFVWQWKEAFGSSVIRVLPQGEGDGVSFWLQNGNPSEPISLAGIDQRTRWEQFLDYIIIGFEHIVPKGLDHILFCDWHLSAEYPLEASTDPGHRIYNRPLYHTRTEHLWNRPVTLQHCGALDCRFHCLCGNRKSLHSETTEVASCRCLRLWIAPRLGLCERSL
jgi:hypothetical protein